MKWIENSELVAGLVITGKISCSSVRPEIFYPPYDEIIKRYKTGTETIEELIENVGLTPVQACLEAAKSINGLSKMDWVRMLENSAAMYQAGTQMEKLGGALKKGKEIDWSRLAHISALGQRGMSGDFVPLSEVESKELPFILSGWRPIDEHIGGWPEVGLILIGGESSVGKTSLMATIAPKFVKQNHKNVAVFSLEMILSELAIRFREISKIPKEIEEQILLCELAVSPEEAINKASTIDNLGMVIVDFADLMIVGETTESAMAHIYRTLALGAKQLHCPIILIVQLHRAYKGGLPRPHHIRYTGLAEKLAWMILMLYNPSQDWFEGEEETILPVVDGKAYMLIWKIRGGFRKHKDESPGAIMLPFRGDKGWGSNNSSWWNLRKAV